MSEIERNRGGLAYSDIGAGDPALVLIHGWCCNRDHFRLQADHLKQQHRVLSVDLPGHGGSAAPADGYSIPVLATEIAALIRELALDRPVVVGHSLGGLIALELAATHPEAVRAIVMVDPAPLAKPEPLRAALSGLIKSLEAGDEGPRRGFIERMFLPTSDPGLRARVIEEMCSVPAPVAAAVMRATLEYDGVAAAARVGVPALHVATASPRNAPQQMSEWIPGLVTGVVVGTGHFAMLEAPAQVNDMIARFVAITVPTEAVVG